MLFQSIRSYAQPCIHGQSKRKVEPGLASGILLAIYTYPQYQLMVCAQMVHFRVSQILILQSVFTDSVICTSSALLDYSHRTVTKRMKLMTDQKQRG